LVFLSPLYAAEKKVKRPNPPRPAQASASASVEVNDVTVSAQFETGDSLLKKEKFDEALKVFQAIYDYTRDVLLLLKSVKGGYEKAIAGNGLDQNKKEDLFLKLQRITSLNNKYTELKAESAFRIGIIQKAKRNSEQARKYLLETCQTAPFSLDPSSTWIKAKNALLTLSNLEGEF
jgi:hypothetical protein